jgi:probable HAF family extracellular repeat protein
MIFSLFSLARESFSVIKAGRRIAMTIVVGLWLALPARAQNFYHVTDLGRLRNENYGHSGAYGINDHGEVVGQSYDYDLSDVPHQNAFLWTREGGLQDLGYLPNGYYSVASAINNLGQVVGQSGNAVFNRAFLWTSSGGMQDLGVLPGGSFSSASGINDSGQVVGVIGVPEDPPSSTTGHAVLWSSAGDVTDLGVLSGRDGFRGGASAINNSGQVVGTSVDRASFAERAFLWTSGGGIQDLGVFPGGSYSKAYGINDSGQVVGESSVSATGGTHAFLWTSGGGMQDLGVLPGSIEYSSAQSINESGQVVGFNFLTDSDQRAVIWTSAGGMRDLNGLLDAYGAGWTLRSAWANNNARQIVGTGFNPAGEERGFLLTPVPEPPLQQFSEFNNPPLGANTFVPGVAHQEMGFATTSSTSGGLNPLVGVADLGSPAGTRGFTHRSINATTTFDAVDLANFDEGIVSLRMQIADTTYEAGDRVRAYVTNGTSTIDLLNFSGLGGADPLDAVAGDGFLLYWTAIPDDWTRATLVITSSSNSTQAAERYDFDSIEFRAVPEPSMCAVVLVSIVFATMASARKRFGR